MKLTDRWKQLLDERLHEAVSVLGRTPRVNGFIVGGSMGRGEPWPMSDIDLIPLYTDSTDPAAELDLQLPDPATIRPTPVVIAVVAAMLIFRRKWSVLRVLGICAALGVAAGLAGLPGT